MTEPRDEFSSASMFKLAEHFDGLATGRTQPPAQRVSSDFRSSHTDPLWNSSHDFMVERSGPLFQHFLASLPCILEEMCRVNAALERLRQSEATEDVRTGHNIFALDAFDGTQARALTDLSAGAFSSHTCSPNPGNKAWFEAFNTSASATFDKAPFYEAVENWSNNSGYSPFDVIYETAAFQFYGTNRSRQIDITKKILKSDGIIFLMGKLLRNEPGLFDIDEDRKDELHKSRYFTPEEIEWKKTQMLASMHDGLVSLDEIISCASVSFGNVCILWNGGNFFEIAASHDRARLQKFVNLLGPIKLTAGFELDKRVGEWTVA